MSKRVYRLLLLVLPGWFREEFADEMTAAFCDSFRDERARGALRPIALWAASIRDLLALGTRLHGDAVRNDVGYAVRTLSRTPTFSLAIILTLAVGMGPMVIVVNLLERVVLRPLPFSEPERLVAMWNSNRAMNRHEFPLSLPDFQDFRDGQQALDSAAAHAGTSVALVGRGDPRQIAGVLTTSELSRVLRIAPVIGRELRSADSIPGAPAVMLLGDELWRTEFGGRADVIGQTVKLDGTPTEIVGVLPPLDYPNGSRNFWVPITIDPSQSNRGSHYLSATARLRSDVSPSRAEAVLNGIARSLAERFASTNGGNDVELVPLKQQLDGEAPQLIAILAGAIAAVLLIACGNVAGLLAVRASLRQQELALRAAIGASRARIRRQLAVEQLVLAAVGAGVAIAIAIPMHRLLVEQRVLGLPRTTPATIAWPAFGVLAIAVVVIATALARVATRRQMLDGAAATLLTAARQTGTRAQLRLRRALVVLQVAGALSLVVVGGLMIRSAAQLARVDAGFRRDVLTFGVVLPAPTYAQPAARLQFIDRVLESVRQLPGVTAAASAAYAPMGAMRATRRFGRADRPLAPGGQEPLALDMPVGPEYFDVMGITVVAGRAFTSGDTAASPPVIIVSETFAREVFPDRDAVGQRVAFYAARPGAAPPPTREIVGIVADVRQDGVSRRPIAHMYTPYAQSAWGFTSFFLRVEPERAPSTSSLQAAVSAIDPARPIRDVKTTGEIVRGSTARQRATTWILSSLAAIALLLASIGLYGVSATMANARSRELAIRTAIGADRVSLIKLMVADGILTGLGGIAIGGIVSLVATRGLEALLYETAPRDPATFAATGALLLVIATLATYLPARHTLSASPADVLRAD
jgi:putative ABC transport system permease protein